MHPLTTRCFPLGTLQRSVCWKLSLVIFFTAFLFFLDVFSTHSSLCIAVDDIGIRGFKQKSQENVSHKIWSVDNSSEDAKNSTCMDTGIMAYAQTMFMMGLLIGSAFSGVLSDRYGKRILLLGCCCVQATMPLATALLPYSTFYLAARCITGITCCGIHMCSFSLGVEWSLPEGRIWPPTLLSFSFSVGMMCLAGVAYASRGWMQFHLMLSLPQIICLPLYFSIPESPRWLLLNKRSDVINMYRARSPEDKNCLDQLLESLESEIQKGNMEKSQNDQTSHITQFKSPTIILRLLIMGFIGLASALTYYGISFSVGHFGVNIYLAQFFSGLSEAPSLFLPFLLSRCGRRAFTMMSLLVSGVASFTSLMVSKFCDLPPLVMTLALMAKLCMQSTSCVSLLYGIELFPTVIRQKCFGMVNVCYRIGSIVNALVAPRGEIPLPAMICYSSGPFLGAALCLLLPETSGIPLPDTVLDCEKQPRLHLQCLPFSRVPPDRTLEGEDSDMKEKLALESEFKKAALPTETSQPPYVA
ncbi:solute carrier family 22 member 8 [Clupea harengus]|uniref:Solute carrier family 22 member 8 n=1 Tax=Clupea harengus TaxID=7950 RepID=A0A6P3W8K0_CLUHA|nr:solute carrier family 22 member 8 [Clupea harengus]